MTDATAANMPAEKTTSSNESIEKVSSTASTTVQPVDVTDLTALPVLPGETLLAMGERVPSVVAAASPFTDLTAEGIVTVVAAASKHRSDKSDNGKALRSEKSSAKGLHLYYATQTKVNEKTEMLTNNKVKRKENRVKLRGKKNNLKADADNSYSSGNKQELETAGSTGTSDTAATGASHGRDYVMTRIKEVSNYCL